MGTMPEEMKTRKPRAPRRPSRKKEEIDAVAEAPKNEFVWRAAEYEYTEKTLTWFIALGIVVLVVAIVSLVERDFFFAVFAVLAGVLVAVFARRRPQVLEFSVSEDGVRVGDRLSFSLGEFRSFALYSRPGHLDELIFKKRTAVNPYVRVPIDAALAERVKGFLKDRLDEEEFTESLVDLISGRLGF